MQTALTPEQQDKWAEVYEEKNYMIKTLVGLGIPSQDVEDCLTSAFLNTIRRSLSNPLPESPIAYLIRAAKNEFLDTISRRKRCVQLSAISTVADNSLESSLDVSTTSHSVVKALKRPSDRDVVIGHYIFGLSSKEQAQQLGIKPSTVRVRRLRAVRKVRRKLQVK